MLEKTKGQNETITLVLTNFNTVIGGYTPDQWEDTTGKKCSEGFSNSKNIVSGKPFLFYFVNDEIEIIKHKDGRTPYMESSKTWLLGFGGGVYVNADIN